MTKADIVTKISDRLGVEKIETQAVVEQFMKEIKNALETGENVYLRGFGSFIIKKVLIFKHILCQVVKKEKDTK